MALLFGRFGIRFAKNVSVKSSVTFFSLDSPFVKSPSADKKKKPPEIRINLIENNSLTVVSLESAKKLASHRGLMLTQVHKAAHWMVTGNRPAYHLLHPGSKVSSKKVEDWKQLGFKGLKKTIFSSSIQDNDIQTRIKQLEKWLSSSYAVEIAIDKTEKTDVVHDKIKEAIKDLAKIPGTIKRDSNSIIRIIYQPVKKLAVEENDSSGSK